MASLIVDVREVENRRRDINMKKETFVKPTSITSLYNNMLIDTASCFTLSVQSLEYFEVRSFNKLNLCMYEKINYLNS